jgi:hypothetical protein
VKVPYAKFKLDPIIPPPYPHPLIVKSNHKIFQSSSSQKALDLSLHSFSHRILNGSKELITKQAGAELCQAHAKLGYQAWHARLKMTFLHGMCFKLLVGLGWFVYQEPAS